MDDGDKWHIYEQAQQSAEHCDTVLWEITYITWGSTTLLLGFVLEAMKEQPGLCLMTAVLSIFLTIMAYFLVKTLQKLRNAKYDICKEIEADLQMQWKQHTKTESGKHMKWYQTATYAFVAAWLVVGLVSVHNLRH